jgi:very-short-patch-repair endonuclease
MAADPRLIVFARKMRREPTPAEQAMGTLLRNRRLTEYKFRRQHPLGLYIADFYCSDSALVVEVDGDSHLSPESIEHDQVRQVYLESLELFVLRFWNFDVKESSNEIMERICQLCLERYGKHRRRLPEMHRRPRCDSPRK